MLCLNSVGHISANVTAAELEGLLRAIAKKHLFVVAKMYR